MTPDLIEYYSGIRGIICNQCNIALGATKDNPEILRRLAIYLEEYYDNK